MLTLKLANSLKHLAKLAKLVTAVTAVKAGDNELTFADGIKHLSDVDIEISLQLKTNLFFIFVATPGGVQGYVFIGL